MRAPLVLILGVLLFPGTSSAGPAFKTANPPPAKTSGALVFRSREDVKACFARVFSNTSAGFKQCEGLAKAIVPPGASLKVIQKIDDEVVAKVQVLDGKAKGTEGWIHEVWISPSPWEGR